MFFILHNLSFISQSRSQPSLSQQLSWWLSYWLSWSWSSLYWLSWSTWSSSSSYMIYQSSMIHHDRDHHHHDHDINHHDHNRYSIDHHDHHNIDDHAHDNLSWSAKQPTRTVLCNSSQSDHFQTKPKVTMEIIIMMIIYYRYLDYDDHGHKSSINSQPNPMFSMVIPIPNYDCSWLWWSWLWWSLGWTFFDRLSSPVDSSGLPWQPSRPGAMTVSWWLVMIHLMTMMTLMLTMTILSRKWPIWWSKSTWKLLWWSLMSSWW